MESFTLTRTANSYLQNKINKSIIFNFLRMNGKCYRAKIARSLHLSIPAVSRAIEYLKHEGFIIETEKIRTANGKLTSQYRINAHQGFVIGVDLGKERLKFAVTDFSGKVIYKYNGIKINESDNIEDSIIKSIKNIINIIYKNNLLDKNTCHLKAICIAIPASINPSIKKILDSSTFKKWINLNIGGILSQRFKVPIYIENDVNLSALGEKNLGCGKEYTDIVFIEISYGIGAGIIIDNHLIRGAHGYAGEIGCAITDVDSLKFTVTDRGCLESHASFQSIKEIAIENIQRGDSTIISDLIHNEIDKIDSYVVCDAAIREDKFASSIIKQIVNILSIMIIYFILILDPQVILIGGDICNLPMVNKLFINPIIDNVKNSIPFKIPKIRLSSLGEDAGIIGASFFAIESLLVGDFPFQFDHALYG